MYSYIIRVILAVVAVVVFSLPAFADRKLRESRGQKVYVPVYSHVYQGPKNRPYNLATLLSIRNVDSKNPITIVSVNYYDDHGRLMKKFIKTPVTIQPMATREVFIPERDISGGSGANFMVKWEGDSAISAPIVQAVMIGTASTQGISFVCDGVVLEED